MVSQIPPLVSVENVCGLSGASSYAIDEYVSTELFVGPLSIECIDLGDPWN